MNINLELLSGGIGRLIKRNIASMNIDVDMIVQSTAATIVFEIQNVLKNDELSDFEIVEEIVCIFEKFHLDAGICHDFC